MLGSGPRYLATMRHRYLPVVLALAATAPIAAQQYDLRTFSLEQGLPSASVNALCEDAEGFLWVATGQGAARGQGLRFETWGPAQGLPDDEVTALHATPDGRVWMGLRNGAVACWRSGTITALPQGPLPAHPVRTLLSGGDGALWLASRGGGVWRMTADGGDPRPMNTGLPSLRVGAMVPLAGERLLAATDSGLAVLRNDRWQPVPLPAPHTRPLALFADSAGVLVGTDKGYVELGPDLHPLPVARRFAGYQPLLLPHTVVLSIMRATSGDLWLGTPAGLVHMANRRGVPTLVTIAERNGLGHDLVRCLHQDRSGGIWAGTGFGGVSKFTSDAFMYFTERDGLGSRIVSAIHRTGDGLLWIATQGGGVSRWDGHAMRTFGRADGLPSPFVTCLGEDVDGHLLAGTAMHGLHRLKDERFEPAWAAKGREAQRIRCMVRTDGGSLLIGTDAGLYRMDKGNTVPFGGPWIGVSAILIRNDTLWCATDSGLYRAAPSSDAALKRVDEVPAVAVNALVHDSKGNLWMGTAADGLLRLRGTRLESFGREEGLQSLAVTSVMLDPWEEIWLGTRKGVHQVQLDVLQEQVIGIRAFGTDDGFIGIEHMRNANLPDSDSTLWFGTVRGAIRYDPRQVEEDPREPLVHLTELQLFYERPDWTPWCKGVSRNGLPQGLELPHDQNHLSFAFTGISLAFPEKVRYRWILEGYDPDWSPITATQRVTYSNIPPGDYTFKVMARNASGIWNEEPVAFAFTIAPPFWRTGTFRIAGGSALLLLLLGFVRIRERNLRRDRERLEAQVANRTRELADEKQRSDELLLNILPASTAEELRTTGTAEARRYAECTVLFSDFKGFSTFSSRMDSTELVTELDHFFRLFDRLCDIHGLEKIKTIGDAYMCAAGIPEPSPTHAIDAVRMALDMLDAVALSNAERRAQGRTEWPVRIGLHSGPVVAGVVGEKKFAYDIWGDTVNMASRMESHGEAGQVNISHATYLLVHGLVPVTERGQLQVKGMGTERMYFVERG